MHFWNSLHSYQNLFWRLLTLFEITFEFWISYSFHTFKILKKFANYASITCYLIVCFSHHVSFLIWLYFQFCVLSGIFHSTLYREISPSYEHNFASKIVLFLLIEPAKWNVWTTKEKHKCENKNGTAVSGRDECETKAIEAGHDFYSYESTEKKCFSSATCANPISVGSGHWDIYPHYSIDCFF